VFYVNADGTHGLVAANQDQYTSVNSVNWFKAHDELNNPSKHDAEGQKYFDWRLPTKWELNEMYSMRMAIGAFTNRFYWSSTELDDRIAWYQVFSIIGTQYSNNKDEEWCVRAVRAF
jgi:hypothetical protein